MRVTAPAQVGGEPVGVGDVVDVVEPGEVARLLHFGQAVPAPAGGACRHEDKAEDEGSEEATE
jgi:hypothetical protein